MGQCKFISCNKCATLVGDIPNGGGYACVGMGICRKSLYLLLNFALNLKSNKNIVYQLKNWGIVRSVRQDMVAIEMIIWHNSQRREQAMPWEAIRGTQRSTRVSQGQKEQRERWARRAFVVVSMGKNGRGRVNSLDGLVWISAGSGPRGCPSLSRTWPRVIGADR